MASLHNCPMHPLCFALSLIGREGPNLMQRMTPMNTANKPARPHIPAQEALDLLNQAWAYYVPEPVMVAKEEQPDLFQYANAA